MTRISKSSLKYLIYSSVILILLVCSAFLYLRTPINHKSNKKHSNDYNRVFTEVYEQELRSTEVGLGDDSVSANSGEYLQLLQKVFNTENIKTIIDFGCGDWRLMQNIKIPLDKIYVGYDAEPNLIVSNNVRFGEENIRFFETGTLEDFKQRDLQADFLILKDVIQHWPDKDIQYFISNILPNFKYALITNEFDANPGFSNQYGTIGGFRHLDLSKPPYNLTNLSVLLDYTYLGGHQKRVYLYSNPNNPTQISLKD